MLSKEVRRRRLVNQLWHGLSSKARREQELNKDGYRWLVRNFTLRGMNPRNLGHRAATLAKTLFTRFGEFTPENIARIHETSSQIEPPWPYADPPSEYELQLRDKGEDRTEDEDAVYAHLYQTRHNERRVRPDEASRTTLTNVAKTYGMEPEPLPKALPPDVQNIDPHRPHHFKYEAVPPSRTAFYERLVDAGHIQEGDEIPEDPPEGWEPPVEGTDDDLDPLPEEDAPPEPQLGDPDFMFDDEDENPHSS